MMTEEITFDLVSFVLGSMLTLTLFPVFHSWMNSRKEHIYINTMNIFENDCTEEVDEEEAEETEDDNDYNFSAQPQTNEVQE